MEAYFKIEAGKKLTYEQMRQLVNNANKYQCYIVAEGEQTEVNIKSMMGLSLLPRLKGGFRIKAVGHDAHEAIDHLKQMI